MDYPQFVTSFSLNEFKSHGHIINNCIDVIPANASHTLKWLSITDVWLTFFGSNIFFLCHKTKQRTKKHPKEKETKKNRDACDGDTKHPHISNTLIYTSI